MPCSFARKLFSMDTKSSNPSWEMVREDRGRWSSAQCQRLSRQLENKHDRSILGTVIARCRKASVEAGSTWSTRRDNVRRKDSATRKISSNTMIFLISASLLLQTTRTSAAFTTGKCFNSLILLTFYSLRIGWSLHRIRLSEKQTDKTRFRMYLHF